MPELLGTYEGRYGTGRLYSGQMSDTPEKRKALLEPAMISFAKALQKLDPNIIEKINRRYENE